MANSKKDSAKGGKTNPDVVIGMNDSHITFTKESQRELSKISTEVNKILTQDDKGKIAIGNHLIRVKVIHGSHGKWETWVEENCELPLRTARRYMRIAEGIANMPSLAGLELTKIESLLKLASDDERKKFISKDGFDKLSSRELDKLVCEHNDALKDATSTSTTKVSLKLHGRAKRLSDSTTKIVSILAENNEANDLDDVYDVLRRICQEISGILPPLNENKGE